LKVAILTTETLHHAFFAREIARAGDTVGFCETRRAAPPPFETHHSFEDEREAYEASRWFGGQKSKLSDFVRTRQVETLNDPTALAALKEEKPDFVIVFGTGVLKPPLCETFSNRIFNLHGGDPEEYRGLDTHLWAIYHRDFAGLVTCLHRLDPGLDTGDIVAKGSLALSRDMPLYALRAVNSELCVALTRNAMGQSTTGAITAQPQRRAGRYYSAMPAVLKDICVTRFKNYTAKLP
jgi:folate-dependent phosphoribosylglycinamide formyltransferase PurN